MLNIGRWRFPFESTRLRNATKGISPFPSAALAPGSGFHNSTAVQKHLTKIRKYWRTDERLAGAFEIRVTNNENPGVSCAELCSPGCQQTRVLMVIGSCDSSGHEESEARKRNRCTSLCALPREITHLPPSGPPGGLRMDFARFNGTRHSDVNLPV